MCDRLSLTTLKSAKVRQVFKAAEYKKREIDARWIFFMRGVVTEERLRKYEACGSVFYKWRCENGHAFYIPNGCKDIEICPHCSKGYLKNSVEDTCEVIREIYGRLGRDIKFNKFELTVPRDLRNRVRDNPKGERDFRRLGLKFIRDVFDDGGRLAIAGSISLHTWHSSNPFDGYYPHIHGIVYSIAFVKGKRQVIDLSCYVSEKELPRLRQKWRDMLERRFGKSKAKDVDIHFKYRKGYKQLDHRLSYQNRRAITDMHQVVSSAVSPVDFDLGWVTKALLRPKNEKHVVWFGWLSDGMRSRYLNSLVESCSTGYCGHKPHVGRCHEILQLGRCLCEGTEVIPKKKVRDRARRRIHCPVPSCGCPLEKGLDSALSYQEVAMRGALILGWGWDAGGGFLVEGMSGVERHG